MFFRFVDCLIKEIAETKFSLRNKIFRNFVKVRHSRTADKKYATALCRVQRNLQFEMKD